MKETALFNSDWYAQFINQTLRSHEKASPDARVIADGIMVAGAFIAEAINHSVQGHQDDASVCDRLNCMANALEQIAETIDSLDLDGKKALREQFDRETYHPDAADNRGTTF